jgi:hypothetical protein
VVAAACSADRAAWTEEGWVGRVGRAAADRPNRTGCRSVRCLSRLVRFPRAWTSQPNSARSTRWRPPFGPHRALRSEPHRPRAQAGRYPARWSTRPHRTAARPHAYRWRARRPPRRAARPAEPRAPRVGTTWVRWPRSHRHPSPATRCEGAMGRPPTGNRPLGTRGTRSEGRRRVSRRRSSTGRRDLVRRASDRMASALAGSVGVRVGAAPRAGRWRLGDGRHRGRAVGRRLAGGRDGWLSHGWYFGGRYRGGRWYE